MTETNRKPLSSLRLLPNFVKGDDARLQAAIESVRQSAGAAGGIGTLSEKSLHATLKWYFEPHGECHEIEIGGFFADIVGENGIVEIQTGSFGNLRKKLAAFLPLAAVTVVYPIITSKKIISADRKTGEILSSRISNLHGNIYTVFEELWQLADIAAHENFTLSLLLLDADEVRTFGSPPDKRVKRQRSKRGVFISDKLPTKIHGELILKCRSDYAVFLPDALPQEYTSLDFARLGGMSRDAASHILGTLFRLGVCERVGKAGRYYLYKTL